MASHPTYARTAVTRRLLTVAALVAVAVAGWLGWQRWRGGAAPVTYTTTPLARTSSACAACSRARAWARSPVSTWGSRRASTWPWATRSL